MLDPPTEGENVKIRSIKGKFPNKITEVFNGDMCYNQGQDSILDLEVGINKLILREILKGFGATKHQAMVVANHLSTHLSDFLTVGKTNKGE